ncbi:Hypothetical protein CINCED_3A015806 [Cinara cedri]|uniref:Uncharacterized protein n=1 Tax=Cinara cedri TaxID=506608 RepID=A0A5E4M7I8_9HEMI|nr:Hypothetical protein CINCED_3A015806 [Cinara cedri]
MLRLNRSQFNEAEVDNCIIRDIRLGANAQKPIGPEAAVISRISFFNLVFVTSDGFGFQSLPPQCVGNIELKSLKLCLAGVEKSKITHHLQRILFSLNTERWCTNNGGLAVSNTDALFTTTELQGYVCPENRRRFTGFRQLRELNIRCIFTVKTLRFALEFGAAARYTKNAAEFAQTFRDSRTLFW